MDDNILRMAKESGITAHEPVTPEALAAFAERVSGYAFARCCNVLLDMHEQDKDRHNYYLHALALLKMAWREKPDHEPRT